MRSLTTVLAVVAVGLVGVASAQPALIVDPWAPRLGRSASHDPWQRTPGVMPSDSSVVTEPWGQGARPPTARFEDLPVEQDRTQAGSPKLVSVAVAALPDTESGAFGKPPAPAVGPERDARVSWAERPVEVIDPWRPLPTWARRIDLIVDPWAR